MTSTTNVGPWHRWRAIVNKIALASDSEAENFLLEKLSLNQGPKTVGFANAHALNLIFDDQEFCDDLCDLDLLLRDGAGASVFLKIVGKSPGLNMNGTDLIPRLLLRHAGKRVAVLGTQEPYLSRGAQHIEDSLGQTVVLRMHGFLNIGDYLEEVDKYAPDFICLGMGMPKQESVARLLKSELRYPCLIICGGAIIDFWGGRHRRAPKWLRQLRLEWLYRYFREPIRMFRRYIIGNPLLVFRSLWFGMIVRRGKKAL